jgi:hypothetical protein
MSDHPPIPPGCKCLIETCGFDGGKIIVLEAGYFWIFNRKIIAAVAEVAWRKEAEAEKRRNPYRIPVRALENATAWRKWGDK